MMPNVLSDMKEVDWSREVIVVEKNVNAAAEDNHEDRGAWRGKHLVNVRHRRKGHVADIIRSLIRGSSAKLFILTNDRGPEAGKI